MIFLSVSLYRFQATKLACVSLKNKMRADILEHHNEDRKVLHIGHGYLIFKDKYFIWRKFLLECFHDISKEYAMHILYSCLHPVCKHNMQIQGTYPLQQMWKSKKIRWHKLNKSKIWVVFLTHSGMDRKNSPLFFNSSTALLERKHKRFISNENLFDF